MVVTAKTRLTTKSMMVKRPLPTDPKIGMKLKSVEIGLNESNKPTNSIKKPTTRNIQIVS